MNKRVSLNLLDDEEEKEDIGIKELSRKKNNAKISGIEQKKLLQTGDEMGFLSREQNTHSIKKRSPYLYQCNFKAREGFKELLREVSNRLEYTDQKTIEHALIALIKDKGYDDLVLEYNKITGKNF